jgi:mannose-6-phosphate isomerase
VYEIQQSSDVTSRLGAWNRVGPDGKPRALHTEDALKVARRLPGEVLTGVALEGPGGRSTCYICDDNFELWRLDVAGRMALPAGQMRLVTALGRGVLGSDGGAEAFHAGDSIVIPAETEAWLDGSLTALVAAPADRARLEALMGDRARRVAGFIREEA